MLANLPLPELAHRAIAQHLHIGAIAIDATVGNGHDTLFLAKNVGARGHVFGFDIQPAALVATRKRLAKDHLLDSVTLFQSSHAEMSSLIPVKDHGKIQAIMFNLGYLPGSDKSIITRAESTLVALEKACALLAPNGLITVLAYPGHPGGDNETARLEQWIQSLDQSLYRCELRESRIKNTTSPKLFCLKFQQKFSYSD